MVEGMNHIREPARLFLLHASVALIPCPPPFIKPNRYSLPCPTERHHWMICGWVVQLVPHMGVHRVHWCVKKSMPLNGLVRHIYASELCCAADLVICSATQNTCNRVTAIPGLALILTRKACASMCSASQCTPEHCAVLQLCETRTRALLQSLATRSSSHNEMWWNEPSPPFLLYLGKVATSLGPGIAVDVSGTSVGSNTIIGMPSEFLSKCVLDDSFHGSQLSPPRGLGGSLWVGGWVGSGPISPFPPPLSGSIRHGLAQCKGLSRLLSGSQDLLHQRGNGCKVGEQVGKEVQTAHAWTACVLHTASFRNNVT